MITSDIIKIISFSTGSVVSLGLMIFSLYGLASHDKENMALYVGILTSVSALYIPSPITAITSLSKTQNNSSNV